MDKHLFKTGVFFLCMAVLLTAILCSPGAENQAFAQDADNAVISGSGHYPSLISSVRITKAPDFCGEKMPIDIPEIRERLERELLLLLWDRAQIILWLKRCSRYMPHIEKTLRENRMPDDLKYISVIESSLLPHIGSSKYAIGYWQFISSTGKKYGLKIDTEIDERRNIFASTRAAAKYLRKLYHDFGSWTLAAAAYNMGEVGLQRRIQDQKTNNFYHLYLPMETQRHILKIVAAKMILTQPERFGFHLTPEDLYKPMAFDWVQLKLDEKLSLQTVADAAGTYYKTIKDLNPEIRGAYLYEGEHKILIPKGSLSRFQAKLPALLTRQNLKTAAVPHVRPNVKKSFAKSSGQSAKKRGGKHIYIVKRGDFLSGIAQRFNVSLNSLLSWNKMNLKNNVIHPGDRLVIYLK